MASKMPINSCPEFPTAWITLSTIEGSLWSKTWAAPQRLLKSKLCAPAMEMMFIPAAVAS